MKKNQLFLMMVLAILFSCKEVNNVEAPAETTYSKTHSHTLSYTPVYYNTRDTIRFTRPDDTYWLSNFRSDFGNDMDRDGNPTITDPEKERMRTYGNSFRTTMLPNALSGAGGQTSSAKLGASSSKTLTFDVRFGDTYTGFEWVKGGKLFGLAGGRAYAGGECTNAGDGWSARVMWHRYSSANNGKAYLSPYVYYAGAPCASGSSVAYGHEFNAKYFGHDGTGLKINTWYRIKIEVVVNTGNTTADGKLKVSVQDKLSSGWTTPVTFINKNDLLYATVSAGRTVNLLYTGIFRGGNDSTYESINTTHIYIDNVAWSN